MRRALSLGIIALGLTLPGGAGAGAATLTLRATPSVADYGASVEFAGELVPAQPGTPVAVYVASGSEWRLVASGQIQPDGTYRLGTTATAPGTYLALAQLDPTTQVTSGQAAVVVRPRLVARVAGRRTVGARLVLAGRLLPAAAGRLLVTADRITRRIAVSSSGRFRALLPTERWGRLRVSLQLAADAGWEPLRRSYVVRLRALRLALGSAGAAVRGLESRLVKLRFALRGVDRFFGSDTYAAVLAFQKLHGMRRTGRVGRAFWRTLRRASVPRARSPHGTHIEVLKRQQVMFEVRDGQVAKVVHVSTGATGNTPVGRWRVYRLGPGFNALGMYYSLYFLRGFAIHGYRSVPPYPASHGCVRTPMWFATGFYSRWGRIGAAVYVFP